MKRVGNQTFRRVWIPARICMVAEEAGPNDDEFHLFQCFEPSVVHASRFPQPGTRRRCQHRVDRATLSRATSVTVFPNGSTMVHVEFAISQVSKLHTLWRQ